MLKVRIRFRVFGVLSTNHLLNKFILAGNRLDSLRCLLSCIIGSLMVGLRRRVCLEVCLQADISIRYPR